jgi:hypothetical protein
MVPRTASISVPNTTKNIVASAIKGTTKIKKQYLFSLFLSFFTLASNDWIREWGYRYFKYIYTNKQEERPKKMLLKFALAISITPI